MIWLTWRQFRAQAVVAAVGLVALALYLVYLGNAIRHSYDTDIVGCLPADCDLALREFRHDYGDTVGLLGALLIAVPGLIGIFWGAPLVARELEERTDRLAWSQSVTRTRWLAVKLGFIALVTIAVTSLFSLLLTWSASRYDQVIGGRFAAMSFDARNIVPIGYGLLAFVLGTVAGMVIRRTVLAMAITLAAFAIIQVLVPTAIRQHLMSPVTETVTLDAEVFQRMDGMSLRETGMFIHGYSVPDGWALTEESQVFNADGTPYTEAAARTCFAGADRKATEACTIAQNLRFTHTYQPGSRYWAFQWIELGLFVALSALLAGFAFWWLRKRMT